MSERRSYSVILVPEGGEASRTFHLSPLRLRLLKWGGAMALLLLVLVVASWGLLAVRASRVAELEARLDRAAAAEERVALLAEQLADLERRYARLRSMFGADSAGASSGPWLPPPAGGTSAPRPEGEVSTRPTSWPLTRRGFVTQSHLDTGAGEHPGLDIAVAADEYVRAAGAGRVDVVAEDEVYGRYVELDHGGDLRSRYAHNGRIFVRPGARVRRNQVLALSGSTGRSTAPHLHFEILRGGHPVDPTTFVTRP